MASTARQSKPARKGAPEPARRPPAAWSTGARTSQTFSPSSPSPRPANGGAPAASFPPLGQANGARPAEPQQDRVLQSLSGLKGTTITISTKSAQRYEGVIASTTTEGDNAGVTLKDVREISTADAPNKDSLFISSTNIDTWASGPAGAKVPNGDSFRTDTDISGKSGTRRERELQAWQPTGSDAATAGGAPHGDDLTFGSGTNNTPWDQFTANEKLFGVKAGFDEDAYTTRLDRSAPDFKERERKAQRIANEIIGATTNNPHIAEERHMNVVDDSSTNEEDKYGAVVRGTNAYIPPGARKPNSGAPSIPPSTAKPEIPKVAINGPDGTAIKPHPQSPPPLVANAVSKAASPPANANSNKPPADPLPAFRDFVTNERQRLTQKRQALVKNEMDKRMAELVKFSKSFKLNKPIPDDLVPILAKDEEKQKAIREKSSKDAASEQARTIGGSSNAAPAVGSPRAPAAQADSSKPAGKPTGGPTVSKSSSSVAQPAPNASKVSVTKAVSAESKPASKPSLNMVIQAIPPFKGAKPQQQQQQQQQRQQTLPVRTTPTVATNGLSVIPPFGGNAPPVSPTTAANNKLNAKASSFRPNPKVTSSPAASTVPSASVSPKPKHDTIATAPNPFFGTRPIKKSPPVSIKDDFNPFKHNKVSDSKDISAMWPYNGKRYMQMFPPPQHQPPQHPSPHMAPPGPPPMPPQTYDEDAAAQASQRGYVYAYPPYGYPGQHMMPGMAHPGPPGAYMPGPFMQHMAYPPGMPPPNAMYAAPGMGQMPPPQAYMPPPPGGYPPPNGSGPRPSMPPTPIPTHAHPYYHQSPQLQHAVPYMMMPPPAQGVPPHPYDGGQAPPVPMGHA